MNTNKIKTKMLEVLNDTVAFYSENTSRRATSNGDCLYYDKDHDNKCAVGRLLNKRDLTYLEKEEMLMGYSVIEIMNVITSRKVKELPRGFLMNLQTLHDEDDYWNDTITKEGREFVKEIRTKILHDYYTNERTG